MGNRKSEKLISVLPSQTLRFVSLYCGMFSLICKWFVPEINYKDAIYVVRLGAKPKTTVWKLGRSLAIFNPV